MELHIQNMQVYPLLLRLPAVKPTNAYYLILMVLKGLLGRLNYCPNEKSLTSTEFDVKSCSFQPFEDKYSGNYFLDIMRLFIPILFMHLIAITSIELFVY
uniref:Uncharacterized protein n=1 Tax=Trichobilharzia regenti TaxID=157069 RepID=A0AA85JJ98_TRIRE|nr:unnamed protein product [Trichobilharzia regenti]